MDGHEARISWRCCVREAARQGERIDAALVKGRELAALRA
jgi:hypothetical protein